MSGSICRKDFLPLCNRQNIFGKRDYISSSFQILNIMKETGKKLSELAKCMQRFPQVLVNVPVKEKKDLNRMPGVLKAIKDAEKKLGKEGRIFVRYSGTENICRIMVEGKSGRLIKQLADNVAKEVRKGAGK